MGTLAPQIGQGRPAVGRLIQMDASRDSAVGGAKGFPRQPGVAGIVFDQKNLFGQLIPTRVA
jgi:hypothetical protein